MCAQCRRTAFALRLVTALRAGVVLATRPRSKVAHLYHGPLTPSGARVPRAASALCHTRTKTLHVLAANLDQLGGVGVALGGRRFCRRCQDATPVALTPDGTTHHRLVTNDQWARAYSHLTPLDLTTAARWARTVAEVTQIDTVALLRFGAKPATRQPHRLSPEARTRWELHEAIRNRRRHLVVRETTSEEREAQHAQAAAVLAEAERIRQAAVHERAVAAAQARAAAGVYLRPHERELLPHRDLTPSKEPTS